MPELPEVEAAVRRFRRKAVGRTIAKVTLLHPSLQRRITPARLRAIAGATIAAVERRGKHQLIHLDDGRILLAHFRMNGDWEYGNAGDDLQRFARATIDFTDDSRITFVDSRALGTIELHAAGTLPDLGLGPDAASASWTARQLGTSLAARKGPIKPALLDQKLVAGLGNIYASEALWRAKINPRTPCNTLTAKQVSDLRKAIAAVLKRAKGTRYTDDSTVHLDVYDREGVPCRRCKTPVVRFAQAGRSTYWCPVCQRN
ncbi:MAG: formamidopyrimidine-DNA glycosylase [Gemmatimonadetes bacterium]|nr:formamidopyrimidine-DNA glycosylase [Gemmatimonadota bacterium]